MVIRAEVDYGYLHCSCVTGGREDPAFLYYCVLMASLGNKLRTLLRQNHATQSMRPTSLLPLFHRHILSSREFSGGEYVLKNYDAEFRGLVIRVLGCKFFVVVA